MKNLLLSLLIISFAFDIQAQQVSSYVINIDFFPKDAQMWGYPVLNDAFMKGNAKIEFSEINSDKMTFYLHGELKIDSIISGNNLIKYNSEKILYDKDYSMVALKTTINSSDVTPKKMIHIYYSGFMDPSRARSLSDYMCINKYTGVYLRAYGYSTWFPIFLEPGQDSYNVNFKNVTVRLPENFKCVVTGEFINETLENGNYIAVWKPGIADISDIQCTARDYNVISKENVFVYFLGKRENGEKIIEYAVKLRNLYFTNLQSIHDASSLFIIEMPEYGDISSQNVIGISTDVYNDFDNDIYSKLTIAHELVHPYVSIPVSKDNPFSALVVEGFPSFFHIYGLKRILNDSVFGIEKYMKRVEKSYMKKKQTGKNSRGYELPVEKPILKISYDEIGIYKDKFVLSDRVNLFLYHIWTEIGDKSYDQFLKELFQFISIEYKSFEKLILKYIPGYKDKLNIWLNTIDYPKSIQIINK